MANGCHLITLRLDTALIDDVGRGGVVVRWFRLREPRQALPGCFGCLLLGVASPLAGLACPAREAFPLTISCFLGSFLASLICVLVPRISSVLVL